MGKVSEYSSLLEKGQKQNFNVVQVETKQHVDELFEKEKDINSIFRGMSEAKFKLYTSLQRFWITNDISTNEEDIHSYISHIVNEGSNWQLGLIRRYYSKLGVETPSVFLSTLSILRHHGLPTPFIDWTRNFYIALFFAMETEMNPSHYEIDNYSSVYEISGDHFFLTSDIKKSITERFSTAEMKEKFDQVLKEAEFGKNLDLRTIHKMLGDNLKFFIESRKKNDSIVFRIEDQISDPFQWNINNNFNIINQEGLFLMNLHETKPLDDIYESMFRKMVANNTQPGDFPDEAIEGIILAEKKRITCYNIHKNLKWYILKKLEAMGITKNFVYPSLYKMADEVLNSFMVAPSKTKQNNSL